MTPQQCTQPKTIFWSESIVHLSTLLAWDINSLGFAGNRHSRTSDLLVSCWHGDANTTGFASNTHFRTSSPVLSSWCQQSTHLVLLSIGITSFSFLLWVVGVAGKRYSRSFSRCGELCIRFWTIVVDVGIISLASDQTIRSDEAHLLLFFPATTAVARQIQHNEIFTTHVDCQTKAFPNKQYYMS